MDLVANTALEEVGPGVLESPKKSGKMSNKRRLRIITEEAKFCQMGWETLWDMFGWFLDEGDVQICTMLLVVAPGELRIEKWRTAHFLESYLDLFCFVIFYGSIPD